jgi:hypothetical protein
MMYPLVLGLADDGVPVTVTTGHVDAHRRLYKWGKMPLK